MSTDTLLPPSPSPTSSLPDLYEIGGTPAYLAKRDTMRQRLYDKLPKDVLLPQSVLDSHPLNVTGVPASCGLLTAQELAITALDATDVRDKVAARDLTAVEVVSAFGRRAAIAQQVTCCLTDFFLEIGIAQAQALDDHFAKTGSVVGPLHGVPITFKDHIPVAGSWATHGFTYSLAVSTEDADVVKLLRSLGAVFFAKTNQPQGVLTLESHSAFGRTLNPHNRLLSPGGSTGGEGALVAMGGSCLGVGSDIGGSIRAPAAHCGLYGMRVTSNLLPTHDFLAYMPGVDTIIASTGPICRSSRDIDLFNSALFSTKPYLSNSSLIPIPWAPVALPAKRQLRIGWMRHDGVVLPQPPMLRGMEWARKKLEAAGNVEIVDFEPYEHQYAWDLVCSLYFEDGGDAIRRELAASGEDLHPLGQEALDGAKRHTAEESGAARQARDDYRLAYSRRWHAANIDVLICPPYVGTAGPHDSAHYFGSTAVFNLLDFPGVAFPTGLKADAKVDVKQERKEEEYMSETDRIVDEIYDPEAYSGAPISLQMVAYRFEDSKLMLALYRVEEILKG